MTELSIRIIIGVICYIAGIATALFGVEIGINLKERSDELDKRGLKK